jgi:hypothetical protein
MIDDIMRWVILDDLKGSGRILSWPSQAAVAEWLMMAVLWVNPC